MKKLFTLFFSLSVFTGISAQQLQFRNIAGYDEDYEPIMGETIMAEHLDTVYIKKYNEALKEMEGGFVLYNPSATQVSNLCIKATREVLAPGVLETVCYGLCYDYNSLPERTIQTKATLGAGKSAGISFHSKQSLSDFGRVKYEIYPENAPAQASVFYVVYGEDNASSVSPVNAKNELYVVCENNTSVLSWNMIDETESNLKVVSMTGQLVYEQALSTSSGTTVLPANLRQGTYLAVIMQGGKMKAVKKFVII